MPESIESLESRFCEAMATFAKEVGIVGAMEGRLLGRLVLAEEPLSQDDLMERTGASRGNVSTAMRELLEAGFVRRIHRPKDRRDYYEANSDLWRITIGHVVGRIRRQIETVRIEFDDILECARILKKTAPSATHRRTAARLVKPLETLVKYTRGARNLLASVNRLVERERAE